MTLNSLGITHELEKALSLDMLTVTTGSLDFNDKNTDINRNYYNIEMGKYLFNDFMVTAAFGLNHDDNRFGVQYSLGNRFNVNAWKSEGDTFIGGSYKYNFF
jgi:translocation and assembly module TamB